MKKLLLLLFLFSAFHFAKAQDWDPMANNRICNYGFNSNEPTVSLWNDSIYGIGDFTIHYLKKVCKQIDEGSFKNYYLLINQPTFLLSQYSLDPKKVIFSDPKTKASYKLLLHGTNPFVFDSIQNISSQLVTNGKLKLFGEIDDSVKIYKLSNADTIILSKYHGIIKFPSFQDHKHYLLLGLENLAGTQIPKFNDFFNFNVGDTFEYNIKEEATSYSNYTKTTISRLIISDKKIKGDSLIYICDLKQRKITDDRIWQRKDTAYTQKTETLVFVNYPASFINKYPGDLMPIKGRLVNPVIFYYDNIYNSLVKSFDGKDGMPYEKNTTDKLNYTPYFDDPNTPSIYLEDIDSVKFTSYSHYSLKYTYAVGLGIIKKRYSTNNFKASYSYECLLTAAKTSNRQYGEFTDTSILTSSTKIASVSKLLVYPNPAKTFLIIENRQAKEMVISILSTDSKELLRQTITGEKAKLDIQHLKSGIYFIKIESDNTFEVRKIIKE